MKKRLWIITIFGLLITSLSIVSTYALLESKVTAENKMDIGSWSIKLNDTDISKGYTEDFVIDNVVYTENKNVESGYIAPGVDGYFDILLDPSGTDVSVRYDISFDLTEDYPENITFKVVNLTDGTVYKTAENTYSGVISLDEISTEVVQLRLYVAWDNMNDVYNSSDSKLGTELNNKLSIPVNVSVSQYLGEEIKSIE